MKRLTPYLIAACVLLGVMAGPQKAHADGQIYACVNKSSGEIKLVAQNTTCKNNELLVVWNVVGPAGPQGPAGVLAFTQFTASNPSPCCGIPITFTSGISAGGGVGGSGTVSSFVLQPGVYQVQFFANLVTGCGVVQVLLDNSLLTQWVLGSFCRPNPVSTIGAAQLVAVSSSNQVLSFVVPAAGGGGIGLDNGATLILTKLQ